MLPEIYITKEEQLIIIIYPPKCIFYIEYRMWCSHKVCTQALYLYCTFRVANVYLDLDIKMISKFPVVTTKSKILLKRPITKAEDDEMLYHVITSKHCTRNISETYIFGVLPWERSKNYKHSLLTNAVTGNQLTGMWSLISPLLCPLVWFLRAVLHCS